MASTYPGSLDTFATTSPTNLGDDDAQARNHAERHDDIGAAMNAVQGELGVDPAGAYSTVVARLNASDGGRYNPWRPPMIASASAYFRSNITASGATAIRTDGYEFGVFLVPARSCTLDRIGVYVSVAGGTGAVVRLGIRAFNTTTMLPGSLILDAGTVAATTTGFKEATISQALTVDTPYVVTATAQGAASPGPSVWGGYGSHGPWAIASPVGYSNLAYVCDFGATGALATSPSGGLADSTTPLIYVRASA